MVFVCFDTPETEGNKSHFGQNDKMLNFVVSKPCGKSLIPECCHPVISSSEPFKKPMDPATGKGASSEIDLQGSTAI